jgi:hypothetical protein
LINFCNGKQTQKSLESGFPKTTFRKTNTAKKENIFLETKPNFSLTEKCFPLTNFPNDKQTYESLESGFLENKFRKTNMIMIIIIFSSENEKSNQSTRGMGSCCYEKNIHYHISDELIT